MKGTKYKFSWRCKKTKFTTRQIVSLKIKKNSKSNLSRSSTVISMLQLNCNVLFLQRCITYTVCAMYTTKVQYCNLSTNTMRRYWSWILLWQYYLSLPDIGMYFSVNTMHKSSNSMELVWKYGRLSAIPFLKSSIPLHSGIFHIP